MRGTVVITSAVIVIVASCGPSAPGITLTTDAASVPADGFSQVHIAAAVSGANEGDVVVFALSGPGLLGETNVFVVGGHAEVDLYAPFEDELTSASVDSTVGATMTSGDKVVTSQVVVTFTVPTTGDPLLVAHTSPDRVVAGGPDPITLIVDGRRLDSSTLTLTADSNAIALPSTLELDAQGHAELTIPAAASPADVRVTLSGGGAPSVDVTLHFIEEGAAAFDITGQFAEVSYGTLKLSGLAVLDPDPQCTVEANFSLVTFTQIDRHITFHQEACNVVMPVVTIMFIGETRSWVDPSYLDAINRSAPEVTEFDVNEDGTFSPEINTLPPMIVGAELDDPLGPLPTDPGDPRVRDDDGDGNPGVTVHNSAQGDQYNASRTIITRFEGTIASSEVLYGDESVTSEMVSYTGGGDGPMPTVEVFPAGFFMQRIDGRNGAVNIAARDGDPSSISCADVLAYADELQSAHPGPAVTHGCDGL